MRRLPPAVREKLLLLEAAFLLAAAGLGKRLLPFRVLCRLLPLTRKERVGSRSADRASPAMVAEAVSTASRWTPWARSCFTQALAAQAMLARRDHPSRLRIGVSTDGRFKAHAWVECGGEVLIGGVGLERFTPLVAVDDADPDEGRGTRAGCPFT